MTQSGKKPLSGKKTPSMKEIQPIQEEIQSKQDSSLKNSEETKEGIPKEEPKKKKKWGFF